MKSYIELTGKYLKGQKKRSVLTVVGIILSTALVTGIGSIYTSMFDANLRSTIYDNGDYYACVTNVPADKISKLTQNLETGKAGVAQTQGFAAYGTNEFDPYNTPYKYLKVQAMDASAMAMLPYRLKSGRLPSAPGEIVLDDWTVRYMQGVDIGSAVTLDMGTRAAPDGTVYADEKTFAPDETFTKTGTAAYTVVGLLQPDYVTSMNFANAITWLDSSKPVDGQAYNTYIKLKTTSSIKERIKRIVSDAGIDTSGEGAGTPKIRFNDRILRLYAQSVISALNDAVIIMLLIVTALVVLATVAVIYNAFNISVVERVTQFGLLRCVGATPRQIRSIIFREALTLGAIGIPIGVFCGTAAMGVVFRIVTMLMPDMIYGGGGLNLVLSPAILTLSVLISAGTIYISALLPARKAGKISPMEAVRGVGAFRKEKFRATDKKRLVLAAFGAEGWIAWKNIGRNRKRFYITTFSMVISIVLFIVFSSLVGFAYGSGAVGNGDVPSYHIWARNYSQGMKLADSDYTQLRTTAGVDYVLRCADASGVALVNRNKMADRAYGLLKPELAKPDDNGNVKLDGSQLLCYGDESLDKMLEKLGVSLQDREAFLAGDGVIVVNGVALQDQAHNNKGVLTNMTVLSRGDTISFSAYNPNPPKAENGEEAEPMLPERQLKVLAVAEQGLVGNTRDQNGGIFIIGSEKLFAEASGGQPFPTSVMIMMNNGADRTKMSETVNSMFGSMYNVSDYAAMAKQTKNVWLVLGIFLYGFVAVISLIGCLNIINTISTNIIVRTRELSVLRAIGMFEGGIRRMVAWESILHSAAAAVVGSVIGTALSYLLYNNMAGVREFAWSLPWQQILIAVAAAAVVAVISGFVPLRRISKGVIMEGIRGEE